MRRRSPFQQDGDEQWIKKTWRAASDLRGSGSEPGKAWIHAIKQSGLAFGWRELDVLAWAWPLPGGPPLGPIPAGLVDLCAGLMPQGRPFEVALDPWAGAGTLLAALLDRGVARTARGASMDPSSQELNAAARMVAVKLEQAGPEDWLRIQGQADLVVGVPPWGPRAPADTSSWPGIRHVENRLLLTASACIQRGGRIIMVMPPRFFFDDEGGRTRELLAAAGVGLEAALFLPSGALGESSIPGYCVVLGLGTFEQVFVGELGDSSERNAVVVENLLARRHGATPGLGCLVPVHDFRGFPQLLATEDEARLQRESRHPFVRLEDLASSLEPLRNLSEEQRRAQNLLFLADTSPTATADISEVTGKEERWTVVALNPERALADYVSRFLNSDLGRKARLGLATGTFMQRIHRRMIGRVLVCVPPVEEQLRLLQLDARLTELREGAETLREELWSGREDRDQLAAKIDAIGSPSARAESIEDWMKDLPFPLASILRRHQRHQRDREKAFHVLVHFFEAFAEFWATILLSALDRRKEIPSQTTRGVREYMADRQVFPLETSALGTWVTIGGKLASHFRKLLNDRASEAEAPPADPLDYFATRDKGAVDRLLDKQIPAILQKVGPLRSQGQAHGGVIGKQLAERLHGQALALLAELRRVVGPVFRSWRLLRPTSGKNTRTVHHYQCDVLMGSDPQFEIESVELEEIAYDGELHLIDSDRRALLLLPLVRMAPPQGSSNACYFYSRRDGDMARFVSYHQETEATELNETPLEFLTRWNSDPEPDLPAD